MEGRADPEAVLVQVHSETGQHASVGKWIWVSGAFQKLRCLPPSLPLPSFLPSFLHTSFSFYLLPLALPYSLLSFLLSPFSFSLPFSLSLFFFFCFAFFSKGVIWPYIKIIE